MRFALVRYGSAVEEIYGFLDSQDRYDARQNLETIPVAPDNLQGGTLLIPALQFAISSKLLDDGIRREVPKAVVYVATQPSDDDQSELSKYVDDLTSRGFEVGQVTDDMLNDDVMAKSLVDLLCSLKPISTTTLPATSKFH